MIYHPLLTSPNNLGFDENFINFKEQNLIALYNFGFSLWFDNQWDSFFEEWADKWCDLIFDEYKKQDSDYWDSEDHNLYPPVGELELGSISKKLWQKIDIDCWLLTPHCSYPGVRVYVDRLFKNKWVIRLHCNDHGFTNIKSAKAWTRQTAQQKAHSIAWDRNWLEKVGANLDYGSDHVGDQ